MPRKLTESGTCSSGNSLSSDRIEMVSDAGPTCCAVKPTLNVFERPGKISIGNF